jgi:3D (Asp-Asp-Asp) domain-containing protein
MRKQAVLIVLLTAFAACNAPEPEAPSVRLPKAPAPQAKTPAPAKEATRGERFSATAYAIEGITASGTKARRGIVAADPKVIPLGSRIRVSGAGKYSGVYLVEDTGPAVKGKIIDIKVGSTAEAIKFGRQNVQVEVLERAGDAEASAK